MPDVASAKDEPVRIDGRRARSAGSRRRIIAAMVALVDRGIPSPTAEVIATEAQVSLRTVFRHFDEMENLYLEIAAIVFERVKPYIDKPITSRAWPDVLHEVIDRRIDLFEQIMPYKTAMDLHRHRSTAVAAQHRRVAVLSRDLLAAALPRDLANDALLFGTLELLLSVEAWQRLREQQGLSRRQAGDLLHAAAGRLVADHPLGVPA